MIRIFSKLILEGKIGAALKFFDENSENAVLKPTDEVIQRPKHLHPSPSEVLSNSLLHGQKEVMSHAVFNSITEEEIQKAAKQVHGSGGPSLMDAKQWKRILVSKHYKKEGKDLREELAKFAKKTAKGKFSGELWGKQFLGH